MKKISRRGLMATVLGVCISAIGLQAAPALAKDTYPNQQIRIVIPYPPGGGTDTIGRMVSAELSKELDTLVWADNKPGASGTIGNNSVAKADPDGYTVLLGITALVQAPWLYKNLSYDVATDLKPVSQVARSSDVFVVKSDLPVNTMAEFIELVKKNPGKYSYGSYGNGTSSHIHGEQFKLINNIDLMHVPYRGSGPEVTAMLAGDLTSAFIDITAISPHLKSDKFKILGVTGADRLTSLPDTKTFKEMGMDGFESNGWFGFFVPAKTPDAIVNVLSEKIQKVMQLPQINGRLTDMGLRPVGNSAEEFTQIVKRDLANYGKTIEATKITID